MRNLFIAISMLPMIVAPVSASATDEVASVPLEDLAVLRVQAFPRHEFVDDVTITRQSFAGIEEIWVVTREVGRARTMAAFDGIPLEEIRSTVMCRYGNALSHCRSGDTPVARERTWSTAGRSGGWFTAHAVSETDPRNIRMRMLYIK